ncbi:MAG: hypothetical protein V4547_16775 [Bacteroidota bacterium]
MKLPKTYKGMLQLLIAIAEHGNDFKAERDMTESERRNIGGMIAEIQNNLGEMQDTLWKFDLWYDSSNYSSSHKRS